jgi:ferritin-like protein
MSRNHKVQVTLDDVEYAAVRRRAEAEGLAHAAVVREAVQEYCVKPDKRHRQLEALAAIDALPPAPVPSSWAEWKREYSAMKASLCADERRVMPGFAADAAAMSSDSSSEPTDAG